MSDRIVSQPSTAAYRENWERIWGKREDAVYIGGVKFVVNEEICRIAGADVVIVRDPLRIVTTELPDWMGKRQEEQR